MANKITKKDNFKAIIEVLKTQGKDELVKVMEHEVELIENKASKSKMTKTQEANVGIKDLIVKELTRLAKPVTITELLKGSEELNTLTNGSNQKVSALMTQLKDANVVVRTQDGKKALFSLNAEEEEIAE